MREIYQKKKKKNEIEKRYGEEEGKMWESGQKSAKKQTRVTGEGTPTKKRSRTGQ